MARLDETTSGELARETDSPLRAATLIDRLDKLASHLERLDSGSGDAALLRQTIECIKTLDSALVPFAEDCDAWPDEWEDDLESNTEFLLSDLRAARNARRKIGTHRNLNKSSMQDCNSCQTCRFWIKLDLLVDDTNRAWGECRRYPPIQKFEDNENDMEMGDWPSTWDNQWCGEWQLKK